MKYFDNHAEETFSISNQLITPGLCIDSLDWKFDHTLDIYNYCIEKYKQFDSYYLSLAIAENMFHSKNDIDELLEDINDEIETKDGIYFFIVHENTENNNNIKNYEYMDEETLSNILYFLYKLKNMNFKILCTYNFINAILFSMIDVDFVSGGWFNTLRKFSKDRFESVDTFGIRKKRYTSIPLLSYFTGELADLISQKIDISFMVSGTPYDTNFINDYDSLSFVDYEQEFWISIHNAIQEINSRQSIEAKIEYVAELINQAISYYDYMINEFVEEKEISNKLRNSSAHLNKWLLAIDLFKKKALII